MTTISLSQNRSPVVVDFVPSAPTFAYPMTTKSNQSRTEKLLLEAARIFNSTIEYEELIESILKLVMTAVNSEAALVIRVDHDRSDVRVRLMTRRDPNMIVFRRELGQLVSDWAVQYEEPAIILDATGDTRVDPETAALAGVEFRSLMTLPLIGKGHMIGIIQAINKLEGNFSENDLDILTGLNNQIAVAIDNAHLYREIKREALEKNLLYEVGKKMASSLDLNDVLHVIMESLRQVISYDVGAVFLVDDHEAVLKNLYSVGYDDSENEQLRLKFGQGLSGTVAKTGVPVVVPDVRKDERYVKAHGKTMSEIVVPIVLDNRVLGVLNLESNEIGAFHKQSVSLISAFATQAAIALERARLHQSILDARNFDQQLAIARQIQRSFLPLADPVINGYDVTGTNISSGEVGGDYYDFIKIVDSHTGVALGDVSGKGMPAALIMASFRASLIAEIRNNYSIRTICQKVNSLMWESLESGNYVTAVYGVLDSRNNIFTFSNCGHNFPFLLRKDGTVEYLREGGPILGVTQQSTYDEQAMFIGPGDVIVIYTDGVTEVFNEAGKEFGLERLIKVVRENQTKTAKEIQTAIYEATIKHAAESHVYDDLTMVIIKRN